MNKIKLILVAVSVFLSFQGFSQAPAITYTNNTLTFTTGSHIVPIFPTNTGGAAYAYGQTITLAGGLTAGYANGTGAAAKFNQPSDVATDASGNIYVADANNGSVRKITSAGVVTTFCGFGATGEINGNPGSAEFDKPSGLSLDASGNIYVAETYGNRVRLITSAGVASVLAGNGTAGYTDGPAANAEFNHPSGTAVDASGNVYVADNYNHVIRMVNTSGMVSTFAGSGTAGNANGIGTTAQFNHPQGLAIDAGGNLYVADSYNHLIRKITPAGIVSTVAGNAEGFANGSAISSDFYFPRGVSIDLAGNIYVVDANNQVRKISPARIVSTVAGTIAAGSADGTGSTAGFNNPYGVAEDANGNIYVADLANNEIRKVVTAAFTISPALPAGLIFDQGTGGISGTPTVASAAITYTITAINSQGSGNTTITLGVNQQSAFNPSQNQNYVVTYTPRVAGILTDSALVAASADKSQMEISIQYADGLGRPTQTVGVKASPTGRDIVQPMVYDQYGREVTKYQPYSVMPTVASDGSYKATAASDQSAFYNNPTGMNWNAPGVDATVYPSASTNFDSSPLNRVLEQGAPGTAWQLSNSGVGGSGHTMTMDYASNDQSVFNATILSNNPGSRRVVLYTVTINSDGSRSLVLGNGPTTYYNPGQLSLTIGRDENWNPASDGCLNTTEEYKDNEGHLVLKRTYNNTGTALQMLSTYYVYDDVGLLAFVLPPQANPDAGLNSASNQTTLNNLCYQYRYDERQRLTQKQLPGKGAEELVYNLMDQLVFERDANEHSAGEWNFTKYDGLGRIILTGITHDTSSRAPLQSFVTNTLMGQTNAQWETPTPGAGVQGYSNNAFPFGSNVVPLKVVYYDDYTFQGQPTTVVAPTGYSTLTRGLVTASKTAVLNTINNSTPDMLWDVQYYDDLARNIKTFSQHYLGGIVASDNYDAITSTYSFTNIPLTITRQHYIHRTYTYPLAIITNQYVYDHMDRKLATWEQITTTNGTIVTTNTQISGILYNELGQVTTKQLHSVDGFNFLQTINYNYNERGWLLGSSAPLFQMQLQYNNSAIVGISPSPQYNGNIASQSWGTGSTPNANSVLYQYDNLNRLIAGNNGITGNSENNISYDLNGNIGTLNRYQANTLIDQLIYTYNNTNQLQNVADNSGSTSTTGMVNGTTSYTYDNNGNLVSGSNTVNTNQNKNYTYNLLNLPIVITIPTGTVTYTYDANGKKLRKASVINGTTKTTDYVDGIEYDNSTSTIGFIQTEEGKAVPWNLGDNTARYDYTYYLGDNLGNTRVTFDTKTGVAYGLQTDDYYPFGLEINSLVNVPKNEYLYNRKELQEELTQYDYGARFYDPVIARWISVDPMAELGRRWSPYNYVENNPIRLIDPDGMYETEAQINETEQRWASEKEGFEESRNSNTLYSGGGSATDGGKGKKDSQQKKKNDDATIHSIRGGPIGANMTAEERAEYNKESTWGVAGWLAGEGLGVILKPVFRPLAGWLAGLLNTAVDWTASTDAPLVGELANSIDAQFGKGTVKGVERPFSGVFGNGDVDIDLEKANIEVKSGGKMKLNQQLKNLAQAQAEGKQYFFYMPEATSAQIKEAATKGITVFKNQNQLFNALGK